MTDYVRFASGAVRSADRIGEPYHLISPVAMRRLAERHAKGLAQGYPRWNWERGIPMSVLLDHAIGHVYAWLAGDRTDDHLAGALWGLAAAVHTEETRPDLVDCRRGPKGEPPKEHDATTTAADEPQKENE